MSTTIGFLMLASCFTSSIGRRLQSNATWRRWNPYTQEGHEIVEAPDAIDVQDVIDSSADDAWDDDILQMRQMRYKLEKGLKGTAIIRPDGINGSELDKQAINWWVMLIRTSRQQKAFEELAKISKWYYQMGQGDKQKWIIEQLASSSVFEGEGTWDVLIDTIYALATAMNRPTFGKLLKRLAKKWYKSIDEGLQFSVLNKKVNDVQDNLTEALSSNVRWRSRGAREKVEISVVNCMVKSFIFEEYREFDNNYHKKMKLVNVFRKGRMTVRERMTIMNEKYRRLVANNE